MLNSGGTPKQRPKSLTMPGGRPPDGRNPAGSKKPGKKSAQHERRERRENVTTKHRWRSFGFQVRGDSASDSRAGIRAAGNSTASGAGETSSTVGLIGATGVGGGGGSVAGNPTGLGGGGRSAAGSPGSAPQVLVYLFRCCDETLILLCRGIPDKWGEFSTAPWRLNYMRPKAAKYYKLQHSWIGRLILY